MTKNLEAVKDRNRKITYSKSISDYNTENSIIKGTQVLGESNFKNCSPLISILTVSYNAQKTIEKCIKSVIAQTHNDFEFIIIDGASTDGTFDIIEKYIKSIDLVVSSPDNGIYNAMNKALTLAKGEYIQFLNSDDELLPDAIETITKEIQYSKPDIIAAEALIVDKHGNIKDKFWLKPFDDISLITAAPSNHQSMFIHYRCFEEIGFFSEKYKIASDTEFILKLINSNRFSISLLNKPVVKFSNQGISNTDLVTMWKEHEQVLLSFNKWAKEGEMNQVSKYLLGYKKHCDEKVATKILDNNINNLSPNQLLFYNELKCVRENKVFLSIIVPIYNAEKYLTDCLNSLISQIGSDIEIICIDDCSTDNSKQIVLDFMKNDNRFILISNDFNCGSHESRIKGIKVSKGKYIGFCDSDDFIENNYIKVIKSQLNSHRVDILEFGHLIKGKIKKRYNRNYSRSYYNYLEGAKLLFNFNKTNINCNLWNKVYKRKILLDVCNILPSMNIFMAEDVLMNFLAFSISKNFRFINVELYNYRVHNQNSASSGVISKDKYEKYQKDYLLVIKNIEHLGNELSVQKKIIIDFKIILLKHMLYHLKRTKDLEFVTNNITELKKLAKGLLFKAIVSNKQLISKLSENDSCNTDEKKKSIAIISTSPKGGAGIAALRLHEAFNSSDHFTSKFLYSLGDTDANNSYKFNFSKHDNLRIRLINIFKKYSLKGYTLFSSGYPGISKEQISVLSCVDYINLHWVSQSLSIESIIDIAKLNKPIIWTLHDMNPFTGGCHYSSNCEGFINGCINCPQLTKKLKKYPSIVLNDKLSWSKNIVIVTPSKWMAVQAEKSKIFKKNRIEVIPNGIDTKKYFPETKKEAKISLNIDPKYKVILYTCHNHNERRKGFIELLQIIQHLKELSIKNDIFLLGFGHPVAEIKKLNIPLKSLGYIEDSELIRKAYSAADVTLLPSLEDNLPNVILESISCGTPVVAFDSGGIKDAVIDNVSGFLVKKGDCRGMAIKVLQVFNSDFLNAKCRKLAEEKFSKDMQVKLYASLIEEIKYDYTIKEKHVEKENNLESWNYLDKYVLKSVRIIIKGKLNYIKRGLMLLFTDYRLFIHLIIKKLTGNNDES